MREGGPEHDTPCPRIDFIGVNQNGAEAEGLGITEAVGAGMRTAIVSDVHGNLRACEAVLADLRLVAPDLVVQGGDLAYGGAHPAEIIDQIRALGWLGVRGNTDEMLWSPESLREFAAKTPQLGPLLRSE